MAFAGGRLLLYQVGGEPYVSPLPNLREVMDIPSDEIGPGHPPPVVHGHTVRLYPLNRLLGELEERRLGRRDLCSMLVVETSDSDESPNAPKRWIGLLVESVQGMLITSEVYPVPEGITELPDGTILGALLLEREVRLVSGAAPQEVRTDGSEVDRWVNEQRTSLEGSDEASSTDRRIAFVLDLVRLADLVDERGDSNESADSSR